MAAARAAGRPDDDVPEDRERPGAFHDLAFTAPDGSDVVIATTRPELLPACVALVTPPDDERFAALFGTTVRSPVSGVEVPTAAYAPPVGKTVHTGREIVVGLLRESGALRGEPRPVTHSVKFCEKGDKPLEIVVGRQGYLRNGGTGEALRAAMLARGGELGWVPEHMRVRYSSWVENPAGDRLVGRRRFFGVPGFTEAQRGARGRRVRAGGAGHGVVGGAAAVRAGAAGRGRRVWSWWWEGSVHRAVWPVPVDGDPELLAPAGP